MRVIVKLQRSMKSRNEVWKIGRRLRGLLFMILFQGTLFADEITIPQETLYTSMVAGNAQEARAGFRRLLDKQLASFDGGLGTNGVSEQALSAMSQVFITIRLWQEGEVQLHQKGARISPDVLEEMTRTLEGVSARLSQVQKTQVQSELRSRQKRVEQEGQRVASRWLVVLGEYGMQSERTQLFRAIGGKSGGATSLEQFDAEHPGLEKEFGLQSHVKKGLEAQSLAAREAPLRPLGLSPEDESLKSFLKDFYASFFRGDLASVREAFTADSPARTRNLEEEVRETKGYEVIALDDVRIRNVGGDEQEVHIGQFVVVTPAGVTNTTEETMVVRIQNGIPKVVHLGCAKNKGRTGL